MYLLDEILVLDGVADEGIVDPVAVAATSAKDPDAVARVQPDPGRGAEDEGGHGQAAHQNQGGDHADQHGDHVALRGQKKGTINQGFDRGK